MIEKLTQDATQACKRLREHLDELFPKESTLVFNILAKQVNASTGTVLRTEVSTHPDGSVQAWVVVQHHQAKDRSRYLIRTVHVDAALLRMNQCGG